MVYLKSWQAYQESAEALYAKAPTKTRYCVKWKASEAKLVLKITDDTTCLKYKTNSSVYLNRFEALNAALLRRMRNRARAPPPFPPPPTSSFSVTVTVPETQFANLGSGAGVGAGAGAGAASPGRAGTPVPGATAPPVVGAGGVTGGGVEKKKKGKKKK